MFRLLLLRPRGFLPSPRGRLTTSSLLKGKSGKDEDFLPDYYYILGVSRASSTKEIKQAYFTMAKKYHPDSNQTWEGRHMFLLIAEAYEILTDELKRAQYDEYGARSSVVGGQTSQGPQRPSYDSVNDSEELYDKIYGSRRDPKDRDEGVDFNPSYETSNLDSTYEYKVDIDFESAALGTEFPIELRFKGVCFYCNGSKSAMGYAGNVCPFCEGTGTETERIGHTVTRRACSYCNGSRIYIKYKCTQCYGTGVYIWSVRHNVPIPPGSENGQVLKIPVNELILEQSVSPVRHFYVYITVKPSPTFTRNDLDIRSKAPISIPQALLGGKILVRGLHNESEEITFAPGEKSVVIRHGGIRRSDGRAGSHVVDLIVDPRFTHPNLSDDQKELLKDLSELLPPSNGSVDGVKSQSSHKYELGVVDPSEVMRVELAGYETGGKEDSAEKGGILKSVVDFFRF